MIVFEVVQTPLVLIVGVGGALAVSQSVGSGGLLLGGTLIVLGIATYLVSFQFLPRESRGALNFYFYSSLALVFVVIGLRTALSGAPQAVALTAFAALLAVAWSRSGRVSLGGHAALGAGGSRDLRRPAPARRIGLRGRNFRRAATVAGAHHAGRRAGHRE